MTPVEVIRSGGVVGVPTDTVYGLAVDPRSGEAVERLFEMKARPADRPIALLAADEAGVGQIVVFTTAAEDLAARFWPGALTMVLAPVRPLPDWVGHPVTRSVGIRVPDRGDLRALLSETGPLAVTSANRSGEPPALDHTEAEAIFGDDVGCYVPGVSDGGTASTVVDLTGDHPKVVRTGPVDPVS